MCCSGCSFLVLLGNRRLWHGKISVRFWGRTGAGGGGLLVTGPVGARWGQSLGQRLTKQTP